MLERLGRIVTVAVFAGGLALAVASTGCSDNASKPGTDGATGTGGAKADGGTDGGGTGGASGSDAGTDTATGSDGAAEGG